MPDDLASLETADDPWSAHEDTVQTTGFLAMVRELPALWAQVFREAWRVNPRDTLVMVVTTIVAEVFTAIGLLATTGVLEQLLSDGPTPDRVRDATPALLLVVGSVVLRAALREAGSWAGARLDPQLDRAATTRLLELTTQVELVAYDDGPFHDRLHRVREMAVYALSRLLGISLRLFASAVSLVAVAGVVTVLHPTLLPLLLLAVVPAWWASLRQARMRFSLYTGLSGPNRRMWMLGDLMADRASAAEVRAYTMRPFLVEEYSRVARYVERANLRMARQQSIAGMIGQALGGIGVGVVYVALGVLLYRGNMPLAIAGTAVVAIRTATASLGQVGDSVNQSYEQALFYWDYLDFQAEAQRRLDRRGGTAPPEDLDHIVVDDVTFTYPAGREPALRGVSLEITPGEVIALVGENGSGKSTLARVISSLYQPADGQVSYGGIPGREIDLDRLREHIAVIAQDFTHWPFTARENITLGAPEPPDATTRFADATRSSGAQDVCDRLEHGYDTLLDPSFKGGTELSGGQWQRIAVARGLYRDAPLLICDEPTAALDARSEHLIFEAIRRHAVQRTVVLITHRLASVRYADRIFVLDQGRIVERGTHAELMARDGIYAEFYGLQAKAYEQVP